uniref:Trans-2-enoyl-CoA reductase and 2,4-dienoyl-CoA reductase n=1 Tax=Nucleocytoviricota sp. TaxID=2809609 RepID=A0A9E8JYV4_9VIRU|nr:trans-2-enoyl-CoA reductase and 2,4-dienoyl-CoA reductase [Nucleocytoviricota sp.]UZT29294.1 trans-2-enoyl-CoA reductase and 2,4-dienoyl-CoA reductase [Nucleocytoviricota sp.]
MYKSKNILITGASSGLGKQLAFSYANHGGRIINISRNNEKGLLLRNQLDIINNQDNKFFSADVSKYDEILNIKSQLSVDNIYPDIIINNAAGNFLCPFEKLSKNGWTRVIDIVLNGSFNVYHVFGKELIERNKKAIFLNISTTYSENSSALVIPSACAKAGVDNMMKGLTTEWSKYGMRFVGIAPGPIADSGGASKLDPFGLFKIFNNYVNPSSRMGTPTEISELALYLTSPSASYINGEIIKIDGGEYIKNSGEFNFITNIPFYKKLF